MARLVKEYETATCLRVDSLGEDEPGQKKWFEGRTGRLQVYESEKRHPGQRFVYFVQKDWAGPDYLQSFPWQLHTSCGRLEEKENELVLCTARTRYVFRIGAREG